MGFFSLPCCFVQSEACMSDVSDEKCKKKKINQPQGTHFLDYKTIGDVQTLGRSSNAGLLCKKNH